MARDCAYCASPSSSLKCSSCKAVYYCGRECQGKDWKDHKEVCATVPRERVTEQVASGPEKDTLNSPKKLCVLCSKVAVSRCGACKEVFYCGRTCQAQHWTKGHKSTCGASANDCPASQQTGERLDKNPLAAVKAVVTQSGTANEKTLKQIRQVKERGNSREQAAEVELKTARRKQNRKRRPGEESTQPKEMKTSSTSSIAGDAEWHEARTVTKESTERGARKQTKGAANQAPRQGEVSSQPFQAHGQRTIKSSSQGEATSHRKGTPRSKDVASPSPSSVAPPQGKKNPRKKENKQRQESAGSIEASKPLTKEKKDEKKDRKVRQSEGKGLKWIQKTSSERPTKEVDFRHRENVFSSREGDAAFKDNGKPRLSNKTSTELRHRRRGSTPPQAVASVGNRAARSMTVPPPTSHRPPVSQGNHRATKNIASSGSNVVESDPFEAVIRAALSQTQQKTTPVPTDCKVALVDDAGVPHVMEEDVKNPEVDEVDGTAHETSTAQNEDISGDIRPGVAEPSPTADKEEGDDTSLTVEAEEATTGDTEADGAASLSFVADKVISVVGSGRRCRDRGQMQPNHPGTQSLV